MNNFFKEEFQHAAPAMNKINPDLETGQSISPARTEVGGGVMAKLAAHFAGAKKHSACSGLSSAGCPASHITLGKAKGGSGNGQTQPHNSHREQKQGQKYMSIKNH